MLVWFNVTGGRFVFDQCGSAFLVISIEGVGDAIAVKVNPDFHFKQFRIRLANPYCL